MTFGTTLVYRSEINSQVMAFKIQNFFDVSKSIARPVFSQDHHKGRSVFRIRISGVVVICKCVCVVLRVFKDAVTNSEYIALRAHLKLDTFVIDTLGPSWCGPHTPHHTSSYHVTATHKTKNLITL